MWWRALSANIILDVDLYPRNPAYPGIKLFSSLIKISYSCEQKSSALGGLGSGLGLSRIFLTRIGTWDLGISNVKIQEFVGPRIGT